MKQIKIANEFQFS